MTIYQKAPFKHVTEFNNLPISDLFNTPEFAEAVNNLVPTPSLSSYKVYTALLTQSGTSDPTAVILENTLGAPVTISRLGDGTYYITCSAFNFFTVNKTFICPIVTNSVLKRYTMRAVSPTTIELQTFADFSLTPPTSVDNLLSDDGIEIRVYN